MRTAHIPPILFATCGSTCRRTYCTYALRVPVWVGAANAYCGQRVLRPTRTAANAYCGQRVLRTTRTADNAYCGQRVLRTWYGPSVPIQQFFAAQRRVSIGLPIHRKPWLNLPVPPTPAPAPALTFGSPRVGMHAFAAQMHEHGRAGARNIDATCMWTTEGMGKGQGARGKGQGARGRGSRQFQEAALREFPHRRRYSELWLAKQPPINRTCTRMRMLCGCSGATYIWFD